jgi:hypothetical protein
MYDPTHVIDRCGTITGPGRPGAPGRTGCLRVVGGQASLPRRAHLSGLGGLGKQVRHLVHVDDLWALSEPSSSSSVR